MLKYLETNSQNVIYSTFSLVNMTRLLTIYLLWANIQHIIHIVFTLHMIHLYVHNPFQALSFMTNYSSSYSHSSRFISGTLLSFSPLFFTNTGFKVQNITIHKPTFLWWCRQVVCIRLGPEVMLQKNPRAISSSCLFHKFIH